MTQSGVPNIGASLLRIHHIVTRGLDVVRERSTAFAHDNLPDASIQAGFVSYARTFVSVLRGHHGAEDDLLFPFLRPILPDAPYDPLIAEHQVLETILPGIEKAIERLAAGAEPLAALQGLRDGAEQVYGLWHPHRQKEERHFSVTALAAAVPTEEHTRVDGLTSAYMQQHSGPDYLVVPFLLYNAPGPERAYWAEQFPAVVTQQLVPGDWREKWAPMRPFLLDQ